MSPASDSTLANLEQRIADLEHQLAGCQGERDEARQRETATTEVLEITNSSLGDLAPVFEAMLEKAMRLCEAETAHLLRYKNGVFSCTASRGAGRRMLTLSARIRVTAHCSRYQTTG